ncbi:MAG: hypothetical protein WAO20_16770 [Acidobacteriota bacterium]
MTNIDVSQVNYGQQQGNLFFNELVRRVSAIPGVSGAALARSLPLGGGGLELGSLREMGTPDSSENQILADWNVVSPGYFDTLRIPLLAGRGFSDSDRAGMPEVAIINESKERRRHNRITWRRGPHNLESWLSRLHHFVRRGFHDSNLPADSCVDVRQLMRRRSHLGLREGLLGASASTVQEMLDIHYDDCALGTHSG